MADARERDAFSGTETTGHEWDGIKELDNPLPRWWLWIFYGCIAWSILYWIAMPAWPLIDSYTTGMLGWSQRARLADQMAAVEQGHAVYNDRIAAASLEEIRTDPELLNFALASGASAFAVNCSQCHGSGAQGFVGYPNLNDDAWLWGGTLDDIRRTIAYGIRSDHPETRFNQMPAFLTDGLLRPAEVRDIAGHVLALGGATVDAEAAARGAALFADQCAVCHGDAGKGNPELGAPDLTDAVWLYGGDLETVVASIAYSRTAVMPAWETRLAPATITSLAIYVHSLVGGR